jgi:hypothetical protein
MQLEDIISPEIKIATEPLHKGALFFALMGELISCI